MSLPEFQLARARTLHEAMGLLNIPLRHESVRVLAGGTDLLPSLKQRLFEPQCVIDIRRVPELKGIRET